MIVIYILLGLILLYLIISFIMFMLLSKPKVRSRDDVKKENIEKGYDKGLDHSKRVKFEYKTSDNYQIHGDYILNEKSNKFIILVHGHTSNREGMMKFAKLYLDLGFNIITYDQLGHGDNKHVFNTMGKKEAMYLSEIISYTYDKFGKDIYLGTMGISLGGATVLLNLQYNPNIKFCIADCPYGDLKKLGSDIINKMHLPAKLFIPCVNLYCKLFAHYSLKDSSAIYSISKNKIPVMYIHGTGDKFVDCSHSVKLFDKTNSIKKLVLVNEAEHAKSILKDENLYVKSVNDFLKSIKEK